MLIIYNLLNFYAANSQWLHEFRLKYFFYYIILHVILLTILILQYSSIFCNKFQMLYQNDLLQY